MPALGLASYCYLKNLLSCLMALSSKCCSPPYQDAGRCIQTSVFLDVIPGFAVFSAMEFMFQFLNIHRIFFVYENADDVIGYQNTKYTLILQENG